MLDFAIQTAVDAGQILVENFRRVIQVTHKDEIDIVTEADLAAERLIVERINRRFPTHAVLAEEAGEIVAIGDQSSEFKWLVDPLDGTANYSHGYPFFCVSVALEQGGQIIMGVVYDPIRNEMFAAQRGRGTTFNGQQIRVSRVDVLNRALVCVGFPHDVRKRGDFARHFHNLTLNAQGVRRDGSAALDLAYVAAARFDCFCAEGLQPWDVAAGALLVEEAGGCVTDYDGTPLNIYTSPVAATNRLLHDALLEVLHV